MANARHDLGRRAERAVSAWLERCGWRVVARRCRSPGGGEVDLVAIDPAGTFVAVEVRARRTDRTGAAAVSVDRIRVARLRRTLAAVAGTTGEPHTGLRVDLVTAEPLGYGRSERWRLRRTAGIDGW